MKRAFAFAFDFGDAVDNLWRPLIRGSSRPILQDTEK